MRSRSIVLGIAAAAMTVTGAAVLAPAQEATGIVAYRKAVMSSQGAHMAALRAILTDQTQLIDQAEMHARAVHDTSEHIPEIFPEGSMQEASRALPAIWENWSGFEERAAALEQATAQLVEAAATGDVQTTMQAFAATGEACGACHENFRRPE